MTDPSVDPGVTAKGYIMSEETQSEVEVKTPAGSIRARGTDIIAILVMIGIALMAYVLWEHKADSHEQQIVDLNAMQKMSDSQVELGYLISLTPEERTKLKLEMPESLRRRIRDR